ncbi:MAG: tetratricopeptide repeat protein [Planctomycetaceae bacterium]|nr:tetratricopeptide repeat protein [Planctomycetaceae bacterium]
MPQNATLTLKMQQAVAAHQAGHLELAEGLYREIIDETPTAADALHLLGVTLHQQGKHAAAIVWIDQALVLRPGSVIFLRNLGAVYRAAGSPQRAVVVLREALNGNPDDIGSLLNLGHALRDCGELDEAGECFRRVIVHSPGDVPAVTALSSLLRELNRLHEAEDILRRAVDYHPANSDLANTLGTVLQAAGRLPEATDWYRKAVEADSRSAAATGNLAGALQEQGQTGEALELYRRAISLQPERAELHNQLGLVLRHSGKATEAEASFQRAVELEPLHAGAHSNLGSLYNSLGRCDDALSAYERAVEANPNSSESQAQLGFHLQNVGLLEQADEHYRLAQREKKLPRLQIQQTLMLPPVYDSMGHLQHSRRNYATGLERLLDEQVTVDPAKELVPVNFYLPYQGQCDRSLQLRAARLYPSSWQAPADSMVSHRRSGDGRLRVGFISRYFREHTIGRLNEGLIRSLDREKFHVSLITGEACHDSIATALQESADEHLVLTHRPPVDLPRIAALNLDLLYYTDLGMDPVTWTLAHSRLAPVQCVTWGHPVTTGIPTIDWFVSAAGLDREGAEGDYSERLVRMKSMNVYYRLPQDAVSRRKRADFGIPEDRTAYGCLHSVFKLHPEYDQLLREILERDERAVLVLLKGNSFRWETTLQGRLKRTMPGMEDRIIRVPQQKRADFMRLGELVDVQLEPIHFGGGNTSYEAFARGVPIVTLPARYLRGRVTSALYRQMGVESCIARNREDYVSLALRLGQDKAFRQAVSADILQAAPALYEDSAAAREFAELLERLATGTTPPRSGRACHIPYRPPVDDRREEHPATVEDN